MRYLRILSAVDQVAALLKEELLRGRWNGTMPGVYRLAEELNVNHKTVGAAMVLLEKEGLLKGQGAGRKRRIMLARDDAAPLRIAHLLYEQSDIHADYMVDLQHRLKEAGHIQSNAERTLVELKFKLSRVRRLVEQTEADAWIVGAGSKEVLEWFTGQAIPAFAFFGRMEGLPIAGVKPNHPPAFVASTRRLIELGHRRIVHLCRTERRIPAPGPSEQAFLNELKSQGIQPGKYNLPDWEDTPEGFQAILHSLFQHTRPTALIISEGFLFVATQQFLLQRGIRVPYDVSLICTDYDPTFAWCQPAVAHIDWDSRPVVRRIVRWAANISRGREDLRQTLTGATFVDDGTVGVVNGAQET
jgi:DNA-binding LacI/PurR family transcriptional regulator